MDRGKAPSEVDPFLRRNLVRVFPRSGLPPGLPPRRCRCSRHDRVRIAVERVEHCTSGVRTRWELECVRVGRREADIVVVVAEHERLRVDRIDERCGSGVRTEPLPASHRRRVERTREDERSEGAVGRIGEPRTTVRSRVPREREAELAARLATGFGARRKVDGIRIRPVRGSCGQRAEPAPQPRGDVDMLRGPSSWSYKPMATNGPRSRSTSASLVAGPTRGATRHPAPDGVSVDTSCAAMFCVILGDPASSRSCLDHGDGREPMEPVGARWELDRRIVLRIVWTSRKRNRTTITRIIGARPATRRERAFYEDEIASH